jgi:hypothetical protein
MKIWKAFARSRKLRITCFALAGALLAGSIVGLWYTPAAPPAEETPIAKYQHTGRFDYTVYLKPNFLYGDIIPTDEEQEEIPMVFFRNIIEEVRFEFSYNFASSQQVANVTNEVVVSIIAQNSGLWQKEVTLLEEIHDGAAFSVDFPFNLNYLDSIVNDIENEIGVSGRERQFIIRAVVTTTAVTTLSHSIEDEFSYELPAILTAEELELEGDLKASEEGYTEGIRYKAGGRFDYEVSLKPNNLYETTVLTSESLPVQERLTPAQTLGPGLVYFRNIVDSIEASFSYQLVCDRPISGQSQDVEITVTIGNPGQWSKSLVVMPRTNEVGSFTVSFPVDLQYFTWVIDAIGRETNAPGTSHNITLEADVHTIAKTDLGTINEVFTQTLGVKLEKNTVTFGKGLSGSKSGTIVGASVPEASQEERSRTPWIIGLVVALLALGYLGWNQARLGLAMVSAGEAEVARARKKYKQIMMDVEELPEVKETETIIALNSLDDLVRIADDLARPVLHQMEEGRHSYCIIDGSVRYVYFIET